MDPVGDLKIILYGPLISFNAVINNEYEFFTVPYPATAAAAATTIAAIAAIPVDRTRFRFESRGSQIFKRGPVEILHEN